MKNPKQEWIYIKLPSFCGSLGAAHIVAREVIPFETSNRFTQANHSIRDQCSEHGADHRSLLILR
jgi:hypothetical protein